MFIFCLWVDHHDEAYAWASEKKMLKLNRSLQVAVQIFDIQMVQEDSCRNKRQLMSQHYLQISQMKCYEKIGLPEEQLAMH